MNPVLTDFMMHPETQPPDLNGSGGCLAYHAMTHCGLVRTQNEDAYCVEEATSEDGTPRHLLAIADGLGGHESGEIASRMALDAARNEFRAWHGGVPERLVARAVRRANDEVFGATHLKPEWHSMQTTLTTLAIEGDTLAVGHVGDCRLYRLRNNRAELLTRDHTMAMELLQLHLISPEQAAEHPGRYQLTRAVGGEPFLRIDTSKERIMPDDTYMLCSDGLWAQIPADDLEEALGERDLGKACDNLIQMALASGGPDNITAILFRPTVAEQTVAPSLSFWQSLRHRKNR